MQLKHLYENFNEQDEPRQRTLVATYRARRNEEFTQSRAEYVEKKSRAATASIRSAAIKLTEEEKALIKALGIPVAQLRALRAAQSEEED